MKISASKQRIKKVFDNVQKNIEKGLQPNVSGEMRKAGYSEKSCRSLEVTKTQVWNYLLDQIDDNEIMDVYKEGLRHKDINIKIKSADRLTKFKGYDKPGSVTLTIHKKIEDLYE